VPKGEAARAQQQQPTGRPLSITPSITHEMLNLAHTTRSQIYIKRMPLLFLGRAFFFVRTPGPQRSCTMRLC
jgi:hypothetical protein